MKNLRHYFAGALAVIGLAFLIYALCNGAWWHLFLFPIYLLVCITIYVGDGEDNEELRLKD